MAPLQSSINLIRTRTGASPQLEAIETSLRRTGYVSIIAFLCVSIICTVIYVLFNQNKQDLQSSKQSLINEVTGNAQKEALYLSIKNRTLIVGKALDNLHPWADLLDRVNAFSPEGSLAGILVDDENKIILTYKVASFNTLLQIVNAIIQSANTNHLVSPQLVSLQLQNGGGILASISFFAVF